MKKTISIILIFTILISMTNLVYADWPSTMPSEPVVSYVDFPYRVIYQRPNNEFVYYCTQFPMNAVKTWVESGVTHYYLADNPVHQQTDSKKFKLVFNGSTATWQDPGTTITSSEIAGTYAIRYSNVDVYYNGALVYARDLSPYTGNVNFIMPDDGYSDNANIMVFLTEYSMNLPASPDKSKLKIEVTGGVAGTGETLMHDFKTVNGKWTGLMKFDRQMYPGANSIKFTIKYDGLVVASDTVSVTYYDDFIDENGDGIDDRTGQPEVPDPWELPPGDNAPDGTILGYIKWAFENVTYLFDGIVGLIEGLFKMTGKMSTIMGTYMGFLPSPLNTILIIGCLAAIILKIFGR
jgi:hypothetical protein